jgi:hypothetical protein
LREFCRALWELEELRNTDLERWSMSKLPAVPRQRITALTAGIRAITDQQLVDSWLRSLGLPHTKCNFETTAERFLVALSMDMRVALRAAGAVVVIWTKGAIVSDWVRFEADFADPAHPRDRRVVG